MSAESRCKQRFQNKQAVNKQSCRQSWKAVAIAGLAATLGLSSLSASADAGIPKARNGGVNWVAEGFDQPESAVIGPKGMWIYLSSIDGNPNAKDGRGYVSKIHAITGEVEKRKWVKGLNAPKGVAHDGKHLFVSDLTDLVVISLETGQVEAQLGGERAEFLNDITVSESGLVFVSDMMANRIYLYDGKRFTIWMESESLQHPNGLLAKGDELIVASWGAPIHADFSTPEKGSLKRVNLATRRITMIESTEGLGNLDGVVSYQGGLIVNDWMNGRMFQIMDGNVKRLRWQKKGSADIGIVDDAALLIPSMHEGKLYRTTIAN